MDDTEQMMINDARAIERAIEQRTAKVDALEKRLKTRRARHLAERPKRYGVEFRYESDLPSNLLQQRYPAQRQSFTVDGGTEFRCTEVSTSVRVIGQAQVDPTAAGQFVDITLPYDIAAGNGGGSAKPQNRQFYLEFFWQIRDTGSDRAWQNMEMPSVFLLSGHISPLFLPAPCTLLGGTKTVVETRPVRFQTGSGESELFHSVQSIVLHFSFHGVEVRR
jgi:hypothetical protein